MYICVYMCVYMYIYIYIFFFLQNFILAVRHVSCSYCLLKMKYKLFLKEKGYGSTKT